MIGTWIPYIVARQPQIVIKQGLIQSYGQIPAPLRVFALVDETSLAPLVDSKRLLLMTRITDNTVDPNTDIRTERNKARDIVPAGSTQMEIPISRAFADRINTIAVGTIEVYLVLLPKDADESQITTIRDAVKVGGELLEGHAFGFSNIAVVIPQQPNTTQPPSAQTQPQVKQP